jgi:hypothetical protein
MDTMSFPRGRPAIGIIPLGTGNDLSRSLNWGGKYRDKPLRKVLLDIAKADIVQMDRWTLSVSSDPMVINPAAGEAKPADDKLVRVQHIFILIYILAALVYFRH